MSRTVVKELINRWIAEPAFRAAMAQNPEGTVRRCGAELDQDEWTALQNWHRIGQRVSSQGYPLFFWEEFLPSPSSRDRWAG